MKRIQLSKKLLVVLSGLGIRLALAPVTGHAYDMGLFAFTQRIYFEDGIIGLKTFPTLPLLYFIQLPFYAIYAALEILGLSDYQLFYHTSFMIESVFLKAPYILADVGIFLVIQKITGRLLPATLYFLNPLAIFESSVWGIYDPLMLLAVVYGLLLMKKGNTLASSIMLSLGGVLKLFGFVPYILLVVKNVVTKRFRIVAFQLLSTTIIVGAVVASIVFSGGFYIFLAGFVFRFIGLSGVTVGGGNYSILYLLFANSLKGVPSPTLIVLIIVSSLYLYETRRGTTLAAVTKWSLVGAIFLNLFSQSEPQWLAWSVPLGIVYGALTNRHGLQAFTYFYGTASTFLITTIGAQGTGFESLGLVTHFLPFVEGYDGALFVYGLMTLALFLLMLVYTFHKPVRFRFEIIALLVLVYLQAYFWFSIVNVQRILGAA